jgi:hypothetical protein
MGACYDRRLSICTLRSRICYVMGSAVGLRREERDIPALAAGAVIVAAVSRDGDLNFLCKNMSIHANERIDEGDTNSLHSRVDFGRKCSDEVSKVALAQGFIYRSCGICAVRRPRGPSSELGFLWGCPIDSGDRAGCRRKCLKGSSTHIGLCCQAHVQFIISI